MSFVGDVMGLVVVFGIIVEADIWKTCSDLSVSQKRSGFDRGKWVIAERSGERAHADIEDDEPE